MDDINAISPTNHQLTGREKQIIKLLTNNMSNKEIANHLGISVLTIETHLKNIYKKLNVNNRYEASDLVIQMNIINLRLSP